MKAKQKKKQSKIPYYKKPDDLTVDQWQKELRRQIAQQSPFEITRHPGEHPVFTEYTVHNPTSSGTYIVAIRSSGRGLNYCECMDYKTNSLGTCKHIESVLVSIAKNKQLKHFLKEKFTHSYSSLFLNYLPSRHISFRIGTNKTSEYYTLAKIYCDMEGTLRPEMFDRIEEFLKRAAKISPDFRCYEGAMEYIISVRENTRRNKLLKEAFPTGIISPAIEKLINSQLYPYQKEGILFAAKAGRSLIADDMGLGKTIQALGAAELLKKLTGIQSVIIICPTSLKYQWKSEIEKFTQSSVLVIEGDPLTRKRQYLQDEFYKIVSYNSVVNDSLFIKDSQADMVVLDEAQRIKNWKTKTAQEIKKIETPYALVLTGTPLENKLEELYSIIQFIDPYKLGPLYKFLSEHQILDNFNKVVGYKDLKNIGEMLSDIIIRRRKKEVLTQLPKRMDKQLFVPMTNQQTDVHEEYKDTTARLVSKWRHMGFLDEKDRQRLLLCLSCMRMVCDSTYILDQQTRYDTKIEEVMAILDNIFETDSEKVVVFSQWERMTRLIAGELTDRKIGFEYLHGGIPSRNRKDLIDNFHKIPTSRVFLSTDAGGVGLNLQCASFVINVDIPWNPAVLEQRIGRVYRIGQKKNVQVINLVAKNTIEHRMLDVLSFKSSLFGGVLDNGEDQIFMSASKFNKFMQSVEEMTQEKDGQQLIPMEEPSETDKTPSVPVQPAQQLLATAAEFFSTLANTFPTDGPAKKDGPVSFIEKDKNGKSYLKIPIENQEIIAKAAIALQGLLQLMQTHKG